VANCTKGYTFGATESVTNAKLHALVDSATISGIVNADIDSAAAIATSKLAAIDGSKLSGLANITTGAGVIPAANLTSVAQKGANSDITSLVGLTTPLATGRGGTGSTAAANAASGVVVLDASSKLPAVDGSQLTGITKASLGIDSGTNSIADTGTTVNFHFTFASAPVVVATYSGSDVDVNAPIVGTVTTTSVVLFSAGGTKNMHWIAVGTKA